MRESLRLFEPRTFDDTRTASDRRRRRATTGRIAPASAAWLPPSFVRCTRESPSPLVGVKQVSSPGMCSVLDLPRGEKPRAVG